MRNPVTEALIKVPPILLHDVMSYIATQMFWWMRDRFTPKVRREFPEHWAAFKAEMARQQVRLPRSKYVMADKGIPLRSFKFDVTGLPGHYPDAAEDDKGILVALNLLDNMPAMKGTLASWWEKHNAVVVSLCNDDTLMAYPSQRVHPQDIGYVVAAIRDAVEHELRHAVQAKLLRDKDPKQVGMRPAYADHKADYYLSPVEFDPQIGSAAHDFMRQRRLAREYGKKLDLARNFATFVGAKPADRFGLFSTATLFKHLKSDPRRYKVAVRKLYLAIKAEIEAEMTGTVTEGATTPLTRTPAFKAWFGSSEVTDRSGDPLVVFHGTPDSRFIWTDGFATARERYLKGTGQGEDHERAYFFAQHRDTAKSYADENRAWDYQNATPEVIDVYLRIENPHRIDWKGKKWSGTAAAIAAGRENGHDGVIITNVVDHYQGGGKPTTVYVVFDPHQIKAVRNKGTFKRDDRRITEGP